MSIQEVELLIDAHLKDYQQGWEQTRWLGYITAICNGAKLKSPKDLIKFKWEEPSIEFEDDRTAEEIKKSQELLIQLMNKIK